MAEHDGTGGSAGPPLRERVRSMMEAHWREPGYTVPNARVYPHQWLWDSCFHSMIWLELGESERALLELENALGSQDEAGFVPHMRYWTEPTMHADFWGVEAASSITQPPMYGMALAALVRAGVDVPQGLIEWVVTALRFLLLERERDPESGLVLVCHPWETGADNSPRWDDWAPDPFDEVAWKATKGDLVDSIVRNEVGSPIVNPSFPVASIGFNALLAWNARCCREVVRRPVIDVAAVEIERFVLDRWSAEGGTWLDGRSDGASLRSGAVRTLDSLLPVLLLEADDPVGDSVFSDVFDPSAFGGSFGPAGVHRDEAAFAPRRYWRGPAWPQLTFLFWQAAQQLGREDGAARLARLLVDGAERSGLAEYWDPDDGTGLGAAPQSWTGLALLAQASLEP